MPKFRSIHTKITQSFDFNEMPDDFTRLMWVLLPLGLDCEGRGIYNAAWIKAKIFPLREDISNKKIMDAMELYISRAMIQVYTVDGHDYFLVTKFKEYQRGFEKESPSVLPEPLQSNSRVTPDLLPTNSPLNAHTQSNAQSNAQSQSSADSPSPIQLMLEKVTGIPPANAADIQAMVDIEKMNPLQEDIQAAVDWVVSQGNHIHRYSSLVNPIKVQIAKRVQKPKSNLELSLEAIAQFEREEQDAKL